mgnify:CR=1 FL=1
MSLEVEKYESIYKSIERNFEHKFFDFNYPKKNSDIKWDYYKILKQYLYNKGYGYIANQVGIFIDREEIDDIDLAKLLMDCNLIHKYNKLMKSELENKSIIEYEKNDGLIKTFNIEYPKTILFNINNVIYSNPEFISHKINTNKKEINIEINIEPGKKVNFTDIISIYTTYGVDKLEFTVKCKEIKSKDIELDNIEEFLQLCENNVTKAKEIFYKIGFEKWLKENDNTTQLINYNQAVKISGITNISATRFEIFCKLNSIYNESEVNQEKELIDFEAKQSKDEIAILDSNKEVTNLVDTKKEDIINETTDNTNVNDIEINKEDTVNEENIKKEKGMLSGLKKAIGSLFKRK